MNKKQMLEEEAAKTYNAFKVFEGKKYTGMKVGGCQKWYYDKGEWKETKVAPDRWEFSYAVPKRRAGHAPPGSGVPLGTEYHWYILAHQNVRKLDANTYTTALSGLKYKLAHKRAGKDAWSASEQAQRRRLIEILHEMIADLSAATPAEEAPERRLAAKVERNPESKSRQQRRAAGTRSPRQRASTRKRLMVSGGRRRR
jgi:hypothetical protein